MQDTRARVLAAAFVAALCTALSACSGGGSSNAIPQTDSHAVQSPAQPAQTAPQAAVSRTESIVADDTAATADGSFTYTNFSYHVMPTHSGTAATAKNVRHTDATTYPMDLAYYGGPLSPSVTTHNIYLDCSKLYSCWGRPFPFLTDLGASSMLQLAAQYDGPMSLTPGQSISEVRHIYTSTLYQNDLLHYIHKAIWHLGGKTLAGGKANAGFNHIYNLFLPPGVDTCFDQTTQCYSPDNPSNFAFCAYHGAVQFSDYGVVLFTIQPYQGVPGCNFGNESDLTSAAANVLSHETFETMTDPIPGYGWENPWGYGEIGDECAWSSLTNETLNGHTYNIQLEYSNAVHACSDQPTSPTAAR
ncbi:MAG TPA: hypothetical protein VKT72_01000 [Candidatus Baltobacteraceae bacterium]|nr:hypothetical protein [Candidatus Baltobacteraceae bacterium]